MAEDGDLPPQERKWKLPLFVFFKDAWLVFKLDPLGMEILQIAFPAALALAADPIASLIDTAFIGHLGPVQLAAVGVAIAIFNQASKVTIFPLVSITTSFVAEEDTIRRISSESPKENLEKISAKNNEMKEFAPDDVALENLEKGTVSNSETKDLMPEEDLKTTAYKSPTVNHGSPNKAKLKNEKRYIPSASTALLVGGILGLLQTIFLIFLAKPILSFMGVKSGSPMLNPARRYLTLRSLGAPAVLLSLAMQGVFRGFKDTRTPLYATAGFLSHLVAGDVMNIILDPILIFVCNLGVSGAAIAHVLSQYLISLILLCKLMKKVDLLPPSLKDLQFSRFLKNGFLLLARVVAVTFCVTLAASMAARLDGLAVAGQAILACAFAEKDYEKAKAAASRVLQMGFVLGLGLAVVVGLGLQFGSGIFSKDKHVIHLISIGIPVLVAAASIASLFLLSKSYGFVGIWLALTIYMGLRAFAGVWRMGTGTGPWRFLRGQSLQEGL
ncbi:MATE efflux family protein [Actinidia rufa]|uniref:Protein DETOXIFICATION n=1 Tax=Actinidia rufa TaxID=165716 RepID=A0A7J0F0P3_9ERIC|nr:MATE efflux family protein [Actinidia rufa]